MNEKCYWIYILHCDNNTYYTGYTTDIEKRYQSHINGTGKCKYTRSFKPLCIAQCWKVKSDKSFAMKVEASIKKLSKHKKEQLINNPKLLLTDARIEIIEK